MRSQVTEQHIQLNHPPARYFFIRGQLGLEAGTSYAPTGSSCVLSPARDPSGVHGKTRIRRPRASLGGLPPASLIVLPRNLVSAPSGGTNPLKVGELNPGDRIISTGAVKGFQVPVSITHTLRARWLLLNPRSILHLRVPDLFWSVLR